VAIVVSDFLTFGDLGRALNLLFGAGLEVYGLQVLGPEEMDPSINGDVRLVDSETGQTLDISSANDLVLIYREYRDAFTRRLEALCRTRGGSFLSTCTSDELRWVLFDLLRRKGWVG
jgi:hypothetical protein